MEKLTTKSFWNQQWAKRKKQSNLADFLRAADHGPKGHFLGALNANIPNFWPDAKVVELGGGASECLVDLALFKRARVAAIDYSPTALEITRERYKTLGIDAEIIEADIFELEAYHGKFDCVTHWGLLEHFSDVEAVLKVSYDLLKPGGHLVFSMPNMAAIGAKLWKHNSPENYSAHIYHSDESIKISATHIGFKSQCNFWFGPPLFRMAPPESISLSSLVANMAHAAVLLAGRVVPGLYSKGWSRVSANRGFYLCKPA